MRFVEIFDDGQRLMKRRPVAVDESGKEHLRIDLAIGLPALDAFQEIDLDYLGLDALEVERDAHAKRRQRAPERKQLHGIAPFRDRRRIDAARRYDLAYAGPSPSFASTSRLTPFGRVPPALPP